MANGGGAPDLGPPPAFPSVNDQFEADTSFGEMLAYFQAMMPEQVQDVYGYDERATDPIRISEFEGVPFFEPMYVAGPVEQVPVTYEDISEIVSELPEHARKTFAMDMFLNSPGSYADHEYVFMEDGSINETGFLTALSKTMGWAQQQVDLGRTDYLDILRRANGLTPEEIKRMFDNRVDELTKKPERVINYIDPAALRAEVSNAFSQTTGRKANNEEMKAFISKLHGLQSSGVASISVGAQAGEFARGSAPVEAGAMDHMGAASLIMQAAGIGGRR